MLHPVSASAHSAGGWGSPVRCPGQLYTGAGERMAALTCWSRPRGRWETLSSSKPQSPREIGLQSPVFRGGVLSPPLGGICGAGAWGLESCGSGVGVISNTPGSLMECVQGGKAFGVRGRMEDEPRAWGFSGSWTSDPCFQDSRSGMGWWVMGGRGD